MGIGDRIKQLRTERKLKQSDLAESSGISRVAIGNYERGERTPGTKQIEAIALALGVSPVDLMPSKKWQIPEEHIKAIREQLNFEKALENSGQDISQLLDELEPKERIKLISSFSLALDSICKIDGYEERAAAIEYLSDVIFEVGQMVLSSFEMKYQPEKYVAFLRRYENTLKHLNSHKESLIIATLDSLEDDSILRAFIYGEEPNKKPPKK